MPKGFKHGFRYTRQYDVWRGMKRRCDNPKSKDYIFYGGKGITYDQKWKTFEGFWEDMQEGYSDDLELDRIDTSKNYCKENCRWENSSVQCFNRGIFKSNTSSKVGVHWDSRINKWVARISKNGVRYILGNFENFEDAVKAREKAEIDFYLKERTND